MDLESAARRTALGRVRRIVSVVLFRLAAGPAVRRNGPFELIMGGHPLDVRMAHLEGAYEQSQQFLLVAGLIVVSILLPVVEHFVAR